MDELNEHQRRIEFIVESARRDDPTIDVNGLRRDLESLPASVLAETYKAFKLTDRKD